MSSLSSLAMSTATLSSPRAQMNSRIASAVTAGEISATDQTALSKALDNIDSSLASSRASSSSTSGGDMKTKMDSLIDNQVSSGTLTDAQAGELKSFFAQGPQGGPPPGGGDGDASASSTTGSEATTGPRGPGGPPPPPPPSGSAGETDDDISSSDTSSSTTSSSSSSVDDQLKTLEKFLENLRQSLSSSQTYGASASTSSQSGFVYQGVA